MSGRERKEKKGRKPSKLQRQLRAPSARSRPGLFNEAAVCLRFLTYLTLPDSLVPGLIAWDFSTASAWPDISAVTH